MKTIWDGRENNFDFIRLGLAVLVIYSHSYALGLGSEAREPIARLTHGQVTGGSIAVNLFFIMSGFMITASAERSPSIASYLKKRVLRIYPAFIAVTLLCAFVVLPLAGGRMLGDGFGTRAWDLLTQTARLLQFSYTGAFAGNPLSGDLNGSVWSIPFEFWCYIGVAGLTVAGLLKRRGALLALFVAAVAVSVLFKVEGWIVGGKLLGAIVGYPVMWARLLPLYLAGVVFYLYRDRIPKRGWMAAVSAVLLAAACVVPYGWTLLFPFVGTYLVFWLAYTPAGSLARFGRFGDFSYGTYLYAFPIQQLVMQAIGHAVQPHVLFFCATPLTLIAAVGSWYGVERWFLPRARKKETPAKLIHALEGELADVRQVSR
ncbi:Peptidoglycan/LPS O-acetylase OafA/YrhL, contains acyltransferase and SGNH-hydrolase domains [Granulicella rosea]|uniref:Peptidoglycan/LPS O-acetylase OafA/YrhL, contains acyltransferase and SGNH-hydrolase domains n=1 Tax=Granulicella rosea TaxID=474952 RepID=A0A239JT64_9BACT|nr:acyltransferase [Granulicella rosea]SNT09067.1 Peptidoglycan/LPS O-acetylase OafA/YrhL, contains acyltransferase and SGNH-hydrolase domains [Granulicella rosea]